MQSNKTKYNHAEIMFLALQNPKTFQDNEMAILQVPLRFRRDKATRDALREAAAAKRARKNAARAKLAEATK